ncbi:MAG TPA: DUF2235 domain-containing protein [Mesorhizobium sp.]|jgi:uncharacterized protein (DUF2235 family)|nr:DUF2235 domain-containing protein [Mesorhizobium sp.]
MPKNIVIFSDGTGQAGGLLPDEARSNVYKLFRACRVCPDTAVNPREQLAFYDVGLGARHDPDELGIGWMRRIYNMLSQLTGLGITRNIIDCYAAIIGNVGARRPHLPVRLQPRRLYRALRGRRAEALRGARPGF